MREREYQAVDDDTHNHAVQWQLSVNFELVGGRHAFAGVEEHVRELSTQQRKAVNIISHRGSPVETSVR